MRNAQHDAAPIRESLAEALPILKTYLGVEEAKELQAFIETRLAEGKPTVMVYGIYNSGKSTLLNALRGEELASVANRPETDRVTAYEWEGFDILDTPGIDAPQEHEAVTRAQLADADVILFVMDSSSTFEEAMVYDEIIKILAANKRLMIIVNNKNGLAVTDEPYFRIGYKIVENLQDAATRRGLAADRAVAPVRMVDAKAGWTGRIEDKPSLVQASGLADLERDLDIMLGEAGFHDVVNTVGERMLGAFERAIAGATPEESQDGPSQRLAADEAKLAAEKSRAESALSHARQKAVVQFKQSARAVLDNRRPEEVERAILDSCEQLDRAIAAELDLAASPAGLGAWREVDPSAIARDAPSASETGGAEPGWDSVRRFSGAAGAQAAGKATKAAVKMFPKALGRFAPYVGPVVSIVEVGMAVWEFFSGSRAHERAAEAKQREAQLWADYVAESAERLNDALGETVRWSVDNAFRAAEEAVRDRKTELSSQAKEMAGHREVLAACRERIRRHLEYMRAAAR